MLFLLASVSLAAETLDEFIYRSQQFYTTYLTEQREIDATVGLANGGSSIDPFVPPPNPPPPAFVSGYLPVVVVNNSGFSDSEVFIVITGKTTGGTDSWGSIATSTGIVTLVAQASGQTASSFTVPLSSLPMSSTGRVFYLPEIVSGLLWTSLNQGLSMSINSENHLVQPDPSNPGDADYNTAYDIFEYNFQLSGNPPIYCDASAVSFFSIPQYGYLHGASSPSENTGLYQPRNYIFSQASSRFSAAVEASQWNKLILRNGSSNLRILSPMKSMAASTNAFDSNYLDNAAAYGYSWINSVWDGSGSYFKTHNCNMTVIVTNPSTATYTYSGSVQEDDSFLFTSSDGGPDVTFLPPVNGSAYAQNTSYLIFAAQNLTVAGGDPQPTAGTAYDAVSKLFEEAVIAGLLPTTNTLSLDYLTDNQSNYYQVNPNLSSTGQSTGPWYDLYSKTLHSLGPIYTYGFDEPLWPNVLLSGPYIENDTYIGITIGNCSL